MRYDLIRSSDPRYYASRVLRECGLTTPPISVDPVLEYFGLQLHRLTDAEVERCIGSRGLDLRVPAFLIQKGDSALIVVRGDEAETRRRMSVLHEVAHFDLPWHFREGAIICDCDGSECSSSAPIEREAFEYAASILFPAQAFHSEVADRTFGIQTISQLAERYMASFAATAIRYVRANRGCCAGMFLESSSDPKYPMRVRYSFVSRRMYGYWKPGTKVAFHEALIRCFDYRASLECEIPATVFGSSKKHVLEARLRPYGADQVFALLSLPDKQVSLL